MINIYAYILYLSCDKRILPQARFWIDVPNAFPWRECLHVWDGHVITQGCAEEEEVGSSEHEEQPEEELHILVLVLVMIFEYQAFVYGDAYKYD